MTVGIEIQVGDGSRAQWGIVKRGKSQYGQQQGNARAHKGQAAKRTHLPRRYEHQHQCRQKRDQKDEGQRRHIR